MLNFVVRMYFQVSRLTTKALYAVKFVGENESNGTFYVMTLDEWT